MPPVRNGRWYFYIYFLRNCAGAKEGEKMIQANVFSEGILMHGHACRMVNGQDIVCSAISALTCSLINSPEELTDNRIRAETASGNT